MFENILAPLLDTRYGLHGAVLAAADGEMVAKAGLNNGAADAAALFGAHQGVILMHMVAAGSDIYTGSVREVHIRCEREEWFVFPVTTEYYLALTGPRGICIGRARSGIRWCIRELKREINA